MGCITSKEARFASKLGPSDNELATKSRRHRRRPTRHPISTRSSNSKTVTDDSATNITDTNKRGHDTTEQPPSPPKFSFKTKVGDEEQGSAKKEKEDVIEVKSLVIDTEVMRRAGMFEAMDAKANEPKSPLKVQVDKGKRSSMILEKFEEQERLAHTLPDKVEVEKKVEGEVGEKLKGFETKEAKVRAEPKLEKCFSQRLSERGEQLSVLQLAKAV